VGRDAILRWVANPPLARMETASVVSNRAQDCILPHTGRRNATQFCKG